jgi:hypothetical protein
MEKGETLLTYAGAGIDIFLATGIARDRDIFIGNDLAESMLGKPREYADKHGYK